MTVQFQGSQLRSIAYGYLVTKAAANLPQTTTATLYTIATGNVLITSIFGIVSGTAIQNQTCLLSLGTAPTAGTLATDGIASAMNIAAAEIGTQLAAPNSVSDPLQVGGPVIGGGTAGYPVQAQWPFLASPGTITWTTTASNTGKIAWYLTYVPLDTNATIS